MNTAIKHSDDRDFRTILSFISDSIVVSDVEGKIIWANQYCLDLFGYSDDELIGRNVKCLTPPEIEKAHDSFIKSYNLTGVKSLIGTPRQVTGVTKDNTPIVVDINLSEFFNGSEKLYIAVLRDLTEKVELQSKIQNLSLIDPLSGLRNRPALLLDITALRGLFVEGSCIVSVIIDIDDFQNLNTVLGHQTCDHLLKFVASKLDSLTKDHNFNCYRISSDRFVIYKLAIDAKVARDEKNCILEVLPVLLGSTIPESTHTFSTTIVGHYSTVSPQEESSVTGQLELMLRVARQQGNRGKVIRSTDLNLTEAMQFEKLKLDLSSKVQLSTLDIALQPKLNFNDQITSFEALLRWNDSHYSDLNLGHLIKAAETTGAIIEIGYFVLHKVCEFLSSLRLEVKKPIYINLSIRQLSDPDFSLNLAKICRSYDVSPDLIGLEITESMVAEDIELVRTKLKEISSQGFALSIDDFGTGHSNLKHLNRLPVSQLKIDKSFIDEIQHALQPVPIVDAVYQIAKSMNLSTVAEGVETSEQLAYLKNLGVDEIQGFYHYRPMARAEAFELLNKEEANRKDPRC